MQDRRTGLSQIRISEGLGPNQWLQAERTEAGSVQPSEKHRGTPKPDTWGSCRALLAERAVYLLGPLRFRPAPLSPRGFLTQVSGRRGIGQGTEKLHSLPGTSHKL